MISREIATWSDFIDVAMNEASGNVSVLDAPNELCGMYFWANGVDWTTTDPAELAACEDFMVNQFAQHIKAFDSYPGINLRRATTRCRKCGTATPAKGCSRSRRRAAITDYGYAAVGAPTTELWMDTLVITEGRRRRSAPTS